MRTSDEVTFGQLVGSYRTLRARITQDALASLIGVSKVAFRNWEMDQSKPEAKNLQKLLEVFLERGLFTAGKEIKEARELWRASGVNVVFDEVWTNALANTRKRRSGKMGQVDAADSESENAANSVETGPQKEEASPSPDAHLEDTMEDDQDSEGEGMDKGRRQTTQGIVLVGTSALTGHQDFIADVQRVLRQPSPGPGDNELKYLEQRIRYYWQDRYKAIIAPADLILHANAYVREVTTLLNRSLLPSMRTRLCACLSQGMLLIGASYHSMGQFQTARAYYPTVVDSAHEANNNILQAMGWRYAAFSWVRSNEANWYEPALESILKACGFASLESDLAAQCWMETGSAEIYARHNEKAACLGALERASKLDGYGQSDWSYLDQFDHSLMDSYRGTCLQQFDQSGDPDSHILLEEARQALEAALSEPNTAALQKSFYAADMAQIHARKGEVETACSHVKQILEVVDANQSKPLQQRLLMVRTLLEPYTDVEAVKDLDREMRVVLLGQQ